MIVQRPAINSKLQYLLMIPFLLPFSKKNGTKTIFKKTPVRVTETPDIKAGTETEQQFRRRNKHPVFQKKHKKLPAKKPVNDNPADTSDNIYVTVPASYK